MRKKILAEFKEIFTQLNEYQRIAFGIAVAERMLPTYKAFSEIHQFGKVEILENAIFLLKNNHLPQNIAQLLADIEQNAPDTEDFSGNLLATAALDTVAVLYELLLMHSDQEIARLQTILSLALNAPYMCMHASIPNPYKPICKPKFICLNNGFLKFWLMKTLKFLKMIGWKKWLCWIEKS